MVPHWVSDMVGAELTVHDLAVYVYLSKRADGRTREAFPGIRTIATDLGISSSTARKSIRRLEDAGCIEVSKRVRSDGQETNNYHLPTAQVWRETLRGVAPDATPGVALNATEQEPPIKNHQEPSMAPAVPIEPAARKRNELWDAVDAAFGPVSNERERGRRAKAVALFRESGCDPAEIQTLLTVYRLKLSTAADTDIAVAGRVGDCRRWATEASTVDPKAARRTVNARLVDEARRRAIEEGPGERRAQR